MSRYQVRLTGIVEADSLNDLNDLLNNLEASAAVDAGMTAIFVWSEEEDGGDER